MRGGTELYGEGIGLGLGESFDAVDDGTMNSTINRDRGKWKWEPEVRSFIVFNNHEMRGEYKFNFRILFLPQVGW